MPYTCSDIEKILSASLDDGYDHDAFLAHIESCPSCRKLGILEPAAEATLDSYLPTSAPSSIALNVMNSIRNESRITGPIAIGNKIRFILLGAIYVVIAAITIANREVIAGSILSSLNEIRRIWGFAGSSGLSGESMLTFINKASFSPIIFAGLAGAAMLLWTFSIIRFRETI